MSVLIKDSRGRSPFWICCFTSADGRRLKKSTKQRDRNKALEVALALERAESMARSGALTEDRARALIGEVLQRTTGDTIAHFTTEAWFKHWLDNKCQSKAIRTAERYRHIIGQFLKFLGPRARLDLAAISPKDVLEFRNFRAANGLTASTVNLDIKIIGTALNAARRQGYILKNPCAAVETLPVAKFEKHVFSGDDVRALMDAASSRKSERLVFDAGDEWRGVILLAFYTGARLQDLTQLRWESVDLASALITYTAQKTKSRVKVPMHPELESFLLELSAPSSGKEFVFPDLASRGTGGRSGLSRTFARIMARARISGSVVRERNKSGRTIRSLSFHSLRHSFSSAMANAGVAEELRMKLTGHSTRDVHARYTHHELESLQQAISTLPAISLR